MNASRVRRLFPDMLLVVIQMCFGLVLLWSSYEHFKNLHYFLIQIVRYDLFPNSLAPLIAFLVPNAELILGIFLVSNYAPRFCRISAAILFCSFGGLHMTALIRGLEIDCGCFGSSMANVVSPISAGANFLVAAGFLLSWINLRNKAAEG